MCKHLQQCVCGGYLAVFIVRALRGNKNTGYFNTTVLLYIHKKWCMDRTKTHRQIKNIPPLHSCLHLHREPAAGRQTFLQGPRGKLQPGKGTASYPTLGCCRLHQWFSASPCSGTSLDLWDDAERERERVTWSSSYWKWQLSCNSVYGGETCSPGESAALMSQTAGIRGTNPL